MLIPTGYDGDGDYVALSPQRRHRISKAIKQWSRERASNYFQEEPSGLGLQRHSSEGGEDHPELAQVLLPLHMRGMVNRNSLPPVVGDSRAVVFGHKDAGWVWDDFGDPAKGELPDYEEQSDGEDPLDSDVGQSTVPSLEAVDELESGSLSSNDDSL